MCFYRYYFFLSCRHQETVLFDFCRNARPLADVSKDTLVPGKCGYVGGEQGQPESTLAEEDGQVGVANGEGTDGMHNIDDPPSMRSAAVNISSQQRIPSIDIGSRSIIAEPGIDYAYSQSAEHTNQYSALVDEELSHHMAGLPLPLFGFRQWMTGGSVTPPSHHAPEPNADDDHGSYPLVDVSSLPWPSLLLH